ncbi:MAG: preprotein translocase subunit SecE [Candidatus Bipolaricaulota bacterium]|nr:preprotein translocase subunit SecE [Candidatus Bipolaricaulota bacterium]
MIERIGNYLKGVRAETARVTWPTKNEVISLTVLILLMTVVLTLYIWGIDGVVAFIRRLVIGARTA